MPHGVSVITWNREKRRVAGDAQWEQLDGQKRDAPKRVVVDFEDNLNILSP